MQNLTDQLRQAAVASAEIGDGAAGYAALGEADLLESQKQLARIRRNYDTHAAWVAGEIARRSSREFGFSGLAQRHGFLTPEALIQSDTGGTRAEAVKLVAVGTLMVDTEAAEGAAERRQADPDAPLTELPELAAPWLAVVAGAVRAGTLSIDAAEAIRKGLGDIDPGVPAEKLAAAAQFLLEEAATLNADQLLRRARRLRDELDADGIARREKTQRDARSFRIWRQDDGMYRVSALLPPEDGRLVELIVDGATSPRRGGPRFVDAATQARAVALRDDERTTEQIAADAILALLQLGAEADPNTVFFGRRPAVRILVTEHDLAHTVPNPALQNPAGQALAGQNPAGASIAGLAPVSQAPPGHGQIEGHPDPVSMDTVKRLLCSGYTGIEFDDDGQCINVGRDQRLFTQRQRTGLAARDGGCRWPGCDRPASWCEAHHIEHWKADHGNTDVTDGILLCKAHHLLLHDNHWHVFRTGADYWLLPPLAVDADQMPIPMPSKSPLMLERFPPMQPPMEQPTKLTG
ncbi:hypothetical protein GCM10022381_21990 [Leifsonia kafniensis]|uniref:HNH nuclease domain-containing protein n=1 Tax=Leifsonia kafniensis TaxID=475957 RepID=A0ABP7KJD4_9MICO